MKERIFHDVYITQSRVMHNPLVEVSIFLSILVTVFELSIGMR